MKYKYRVLSLIVHNGLVYGFVMQKERTFGSVLDSDKLYEQLYSKHFKKFYAGNPTKKYLKIISQLQKAENIPYSEIERLIVN